MASSANLFKNDCANRFTSVITNKSCYFLIGRKNNSKLAILVCADRYGRIASFRSCCGSRKLRFTRKSSANLCTINFNTESSGKFRSNCTLCNPLDFKVSFITFTNELGYGEISYIFICLTNIVKISLFHDGFFPVGFLVSLSLFWEQINIYLWIFLSCFGLSFITF